MGIYTTSHLADINDLTAMMHNAHHVMDLAQDAMRSLEAAGRSSTDAERGMADMKQMIRRMEGIWRRAAWCSRFGDTTDAVNSMCGGAYELLHKITDAYMQLRRDVEATKLRFPGPMPQA